MKEKNTRYLNKFERMVLEGFFSMISNENIIGRSGFSTDFFH